MGGTSLRNEGRVGRDSAMSKDLKLSVRLHALLNSQDSFVQGVPPFAVNSISYLKWVARP